MTRTLALSDPRAAQALELPLLQHPEKLRLRRRAHLADFVEEEDAAGGELDLSGLGLLRAGERAAFVAEELRFEELLRQGRAVQRR